MKTRKILTVFASCLVLAGVAGTRSSSADGSGMAGPSVELKTGDFKMLSPFSFWPSCGCPDLVYTYTFRSEGLVYVGTPKFSDAIRAVANSASEFSPAEIPAEWRDAAQNWVEYLQMTPDGEGNPYSRPAMFQLRGGDLMQFPKGKYACSPDLLHLASLEYRKMEGREDLSPVSPLAVHAATREIEGIIADKRKMARNFAARAVAIVSKIVEAERKGAGNCSPGEIAWAKRELEQAFIEARTVQSPPRETVSAFDRAERLADSLRVPRHFASTGGSICQ